MKFNFSFKNFNLSFKPLFSNANRLRSDDRFVLFPDTAAGDEECPDCFKREKIAKEIATTINLSKGQMNFLISGDWGVGKTTLLKLIKKNLGNIKCFWFSPWKYSGSSEGAVAISRALLTQLANIFGKTHIIKDLYIKKQVENERNIFTQIIMLISLLLRYLIYISIIFLILYIIWLFLPKVVPEASEFIKNFIKNRDPLVVLGAISAILALPPLGQYFVNKIKEQGEIEKPISPELFESKFKILIDQTIKNKWLQKIISVWEETLSNTFLSFLGEPLTNIIFYNGPLSILKNRKIVIFIEDLDRCNDDGREVKQFLSGMKTFFDHPMVYYVVAADVNKLRDKISGKEPEFLRKIIQIDWNVPSLRKNEIRDFVEELLKSANALNELEHYKDQIISIFQLNPNPRKIKYYLRRLLFLLNVLREET